MAEFILLIRNEGEGKAGLSSARHQDFLKACEIYIEHLKKGGNLMSAQPLVRDGKMISGTPGAFSEGPHTSSRDIIVGYYHILANDIAHAIAIAKDNPEFAFNTHAKIEVRPIKMKEESTA